MTLDQLYTAWMDAETREQAALLLHGAHGTTESLALYEAAVEATEAAHSEYLAAMDACGEGVREVHATAGDRLFAGLLA